MAGEQDGRVSAGMAEFPIVGIGASAGGLRAVESFLENVPANSGMAFVVVFHLDPKHKSEAAEVLQGHTKMPVAQIAGRTPVEPGHVYVIPPNHGLALNDEGALELSQPVRADGRPTVIDRFFRSLAAEAGERAIGVVLSGTGTEGSQGLKAIKEAGGLTVVQEENEAEYGGMPHSAIATGLIDFILPVAEMPAKLLEVKDFAVHFALPEADQPSGESDGEILQKIFVQLRTQVGHDFSHYKQNTVLRRIARRMQVHQAQDIEAYLKLLREDPAEAEALFRELLISVTNFFRDPAAMAALEREVVPKLCARLEGQTVRVWVPGCATGEEAYSLAMLLIEACDGMAAAPRLQIFASDVDERALDIARRGLYPDAIAGDVGDARLKRFFEREGDGFVVKSFLREMILFTRHDILKDPPFSKLDLISCRNLLIYLKSDIQSRIFALFHFALKPRGYLFLGGSESVGASVKLFTELERKSKIFQARPVQGAEIHFPLLPSAGREGTRKPERKEAGFEELARKQLLTRHAPPCVIVDENYDVTYISGRVGKYLEPGTGEANYNILDMAREGLRLELRTALYRALHGGESVRGRRVRVKTNGEEEPVGLTVEPLVEAEGHLLVVFEKLAPGEAALEPLRAEGDDGVIAQLEAELTSTRESLQTSIEELETSNEELRASNEELQSMNEELQSTTEELETGKEELQSANEELLAVNQELKDKNDELAHANSDLDNFIASTDIGVLFLDEELKVRRYTPRLTEVFNLISGDIGRPFAHVTHNLEAEDLVADAERVLRDLAPVEKELADKSGRFYLARLRPYRSLDHKIGGVVLTFVDISERHRQEAAAKALNAQLISQRAYAESIVATLHTPLLILGADLRVVSASRAFYRAFKTTPQLTERTPLYELGNNRWDIPDLRRLLEKILTERTTVEEFEVHHDFGNDERIMLLNARRLRQPKGPEPLILLAFEDITERVRVERRIARLASIVDTSDDAIISKNLEGVITTWNKSAERMFGYRAEEAVGQPIATLIVPADRQTEEDDILRGISRGEAIDHFETVRQRKDGSTLDVSVTISPLRNTRGRIIGASKIARDITERKHEEHYRKLLVNELNHRVKNTLATVQSIAMQTFAGSPADAEMAWRFESRLMALAKTHRLLTRSRWRSVSLHDLLAQELAPFTGGGKRDRAVIAGANVELGTKAAVTLGMAFHELATNAVKYGALSRPEGTVRIVSKLLDGEHRRFRLTWTETGGPEVEEPTRRGFGTRLVASGLAHELNAQVRMDYKREGLVCTMDIPLTENSGGGG